MFIRALNENDSEMYQELRLIALEKSPEAFGSSYEKEKNYALETIKQKIISTKTKYTLGAFNNEDVLIGISVFNRDNNAKMRHKAYITGLYVSTTSRGQGIGKSLLTEMINIAKNLNGVEQINLTVVSTNLIAKKLYTNLGFKVFGTEIRAIKYNDKYYSEDLMVLFL